MAEITTGNDIAQFAASLHLVRAEVDNALDHASAQLDAYANGGGKEGLRTFLEEIQQLRGTFKMLDFRAGERLCEEIAELARSWRSDEVSPTILGAYTQAVVYLKQYIELVVDDKLVSPSLLIPTINLLRRSRHERPLPEAYFFLVNLRPRIETPPAISGTSISYRRVRQLLQLGMLGLIRGAGRHGPMQIILRAIVRVEEDARGTPSWSFWLVAKAAVEALGQPAFEVTNQRISLLGVLDRQVRRIQQSEGAALQEKLPDWVLKELLYLVALAEPDSEAVITVQEKFQLSGTVRELQLVESRRNLIGPDHSAMLSFARALQDEVESLKDIIDRNQRNPDMAVDDAELVERLDRIADTLAMVNMSEAAQRAESLVAMIRKGSPELNHLADEVIRIEQDIYTLTHKVGADNGQVIDQVTLNEGRISIVAEAVTALVMVKRAVASYLDTGDKLHVQNVGKSLHDVGGAVLFLEKPMLRDILLELEGFIVANVLESRQAPQQRQLEAFADSVTAIEYFLDTLNGPSAGADEAIRLATESLNYLREPHVAG